MSRYDKDRFAESAFKRLYWQGYQGRFGIFRWPTTFNFPFGTVEGRGFNLNNFDHGEFRGWQSGLPLRRLLTRLNNRYPGRVRVFAHSQGNIVAGEALKLATQPLVAVYVAMQAIDLLDGTKVESSDALGDFRISVKRANDARFGERYDWSFDIEPINGAIQEEKDPYSSMYIAPPEGYIPKFTFAIQAADANWGYASRKRFYLKSRSGTSYGRLELEVIAFYDLDKQNGAVRLEWAVNPTGSRILR